MSLKVAVYYSMVLIKVAKGHWEDRAWEEIVWAKIA